MNAQMKKGILEMCILHNVQFFQPIYGYDLIKKMNVFFPEVNESTFYSILRRLNTNGFLCVVLQNSHEGPPRKYYSTTKEGDQLLNEYIIEWSDLNKIINTMGIL